MFAKIWRWLKKLWQQLLGKPPQPSSPGAGTLGGEPNPRLSDAELESLFLQLLDIVEESASRGYIKGFLIAKNIKEDELVAWLRRFGSKLLESPENHRKLARRMVQLGNVAGGELGDVAGEIGRELLGNSETQTSIVATSVKPIVHNPTADTTIFVSEDVPVDREAEEWYNQGVDQYQAGNIQAALNCFQQAIEIFPNYHNAWNNLGGMLYNLGQYQPAIEAYQRAIAISPNYDYAWNGLGNALYYLAQYQQSIEAFQRAIEISPNYHNAWNGLAGVLNHLGQYKEALAAIRSALKISPNDHILWNSLGATLKNLGQYEEAIAAYRRAIAILPNYHNAWNSLGNALSDLGKYNEGIDSFRRALAISPNFHDAWNNLGLTLKELGQYKEAIDSYQRALEIFPRSHLAWNGLGYTLNSLGQYQQAIEAFNCALEITHNQYWMAWANRGLAINKLYGYQTALQNWDEGLQSLQAETRDYQEGCASLHWQKGVAHYDYGQQQPNPHPYWRESRNSYITALKTLSGSQTSILGEVLVAQISPRFQLLYLEILQNLAKVCNALNYQDDFQLCLDIGDTMLENLLLETESQERKIQLANKFATFSQLRVVLLAQSSQLKEALLLAEKRKNLCLRWLRESRYVGMLDQTPLQYPEIEQFLSPGMAAIYWHYSPAAITTFIIKYNGIQIHSGEPPSPNPFPRNGGRGEREDDDNSVTNFPLQRGRGEREDDDNTLAPLPVAGRGWGWGSSNSGEPPSPNPFPRNGGRGEREEDDHSVTNFPLQGGKGERQEDDNTLASLPVAGRGWGWGSPVKQLEKFEDWLKAWKEDYQNNRKDAKNAKEEKETWRQKMADRLDELGKILDIEGILNKIGDDITHLILIPHRDLHLLPLHYLWREKDFTITYLPSLKVGIDLSIPPSPVTKLLSIENPLEDLLFAPVESSAISRLFTECDRIPSPNATISVVKTSLKNASGCFHFTGHAYHDPNYPRNSALILASEPNLTLADIFAFNSLNLQLVCLAACETGITGKEGLIDEFVGLASGFLATGVSYVVSSLWRVEERSTALLMIQFYHYIIDEKIMPAIALNKAQNWLRQLTYGELAEWYLQLAPQFTEKSDRRLQSLLQREGQRLLDSAKINLSDRPYQQPYYWAGFTITGAF